MAGYPEDMDKDKIAMPGFFANLRMVREMSKLGVLPSSLALGTLGMPGYVYLTWLSTLRFLGYSVLRGTDLKNML